MICHVLWEVSIVPLNGGNAFDLQHMKKDAHVKLTLIFMCYFHFSLAVLRAA